MATQIVCDESPGEDKLELLERMARHRHLVIYKQSDDCNGGISRTNSAVHTKRNGLEGGVSEKAGGGRG